VGNSDHTPADRLDSLRAEIHGSYGFWGADDLEAAVGAALKVGPPRGHPSTIRDVASGLRRAAAGADQVRQTVRKTGQDRLPQVWLGVTAVSAGEVLAAEARGCEHISEQLDRCARLLDHLADEIESAQAMDAAGRGPLGHAAQLLHGHTGWLDYDGEKVKAAHHEAMTGIDALAAAAKKARRAGEDVARDLHQSASTAHAGKMHGNGLSPVDKVVVTDAAVPGGPHDSNLILSANQAARAEDRLDGLSPADRARFDRLLADARSPQERAYLLAALAAGYDVNQIAAFDNQIHAHGDDPQWLGNHLTPIVNTDEDDDARHATTFDGREWTQGQDPTCVASSTVLARAKVDPMYALYLTTGGHPDDPNFDSGDGFAQRLHDEQHRVYDSARPGYADWPVIGYDGVADDDSVPVVNSEVGQHDGVTYHNVKLDSAADRHNALPAIEQSVDDGKPVPVSVTGHKGHGMMIVGHDGNMLEIYNPWGYTTWVTEDEFVNGQLGHMPDGPPPTPDSVRLPN
jgi:hypothetical protein